MDYVDLKHILLDLDDLDLRSVQMVVKVELERRETVEILGEIVCSI